MSSYPFPFPKPRTAIAYPSSLEELESLRIAHGKFVRPEMVGIHALQPFVTKNSPSRSVMLTQHLPQHLVVEDMEHPPIIAGPEYKLSKHTIAERMPEDGTVLEVIHRYPPGMGGNNRVKRNPETIVLVEYYVEGKGMVIDAIPLKQYTSYHQHFGFFNKPHKDLSTKLTPKATIPKGFAFTDSPAVMDDGCYTVGVAPMTCKLDVPGVAEDGIIVRRGYLDKISSWVFEEREIGFGANEIPMDLYGSGDDVKIFPDIGEEVPRSGLLMATRKVANHLAAATLGKQDLRELHHTFDTKLYTREATTDKDGTMVSSPGIVLDVIVIKNGETTRLPPSLAGQLEEYARLYRAFHSRLLDFESRKILENKRMGGDGVLNISERLHGMLVYARAITGQASNRFTGNVTLQERRTPLDEYTVKFVIAHKLLPNFGFKATGAAGDVNLV